MEDFHDYLIAVAHVSDRHAPYYIGWVRHAYEIAGRPLDEPLPPEEEQQALVKLQQQREA